MPSDLSLLLTQLNTSGLLSSNPALYQLIKSLISAVREVVNNSSASGGSSDLTALEAQITALESFTYLTVTDESGTLANSRRALAGQNIEFDDSVANERTVNTGNWSVLTNGDPVTPELIFAGGDVVMVYTP